MKNRLIYLAFAVILLAIIVFAGSCKTPQQLAQKHLKKALRLDPSILSQYNVDTTVRGYKDTVLDVTAPAIDRSTEYLTIDSLQRVLRNFAASKDTSKTAIYLYKDSTTSIQVQKKDGKLAVAFHVEQLHIRDTIRVPYEVRITVPAKAIKTNIYAPAYRYFWFWGLVVALLLETYLLVNQSRKIPR